jgi:hypothetical protein
VALMDYTQAAKAYYYVLPGLREGFVNFCSKHNQGFLADIKKSFLLCSIVDFLFEQHIPAFDPVLAADNMKGFCDFKSDFQKGILSYVAEFGGNYELSDEQKEYIKVKIANEDHQLLQFLKPENLNQCNISKASVITDIMGLFIPLPLGTVLEAAKEIRRLEAFERANLSFILSLTILKKIANVGEVEKPVNCAVCSISPAEIEKMTEQECDDLMYSLNLCVPHMVARIDLKKRFRLYGKARLKEMKRLGDASIWAKSPMEE